MITIKVDVRKDLARLKAAAGTDAPKIMREFMMKQGRALISSSGNVPGLVQVTAPYSQGKKGTAAKKQGEAAVSADINRVYGSPSRLYKLIRDKNKGAAAAFWQHVRKKQWTQANDIADRLTGERMREFDDGSAHSSRRNNRGRVPKSGKPSLYIAQAGGQDGKKAGAWVAAYIKQKQALVGLLASALVRSATSVFGPLAGVPEWVRRHASSNQGRCYIDETKNGMTVGAVNLSPRGQSDLQRKFDYVAGYRLKAMARELPYVVKAIEKKLQTALT